MKNKKIEIRVDEETKNLFQKYAGIQKNNMSQFIIDSVLYRIKHDKLIRPLT